MVQKPHSCDKMAQTGVGLCLLGPLVLYRQNGQVGTIVV